MEGGKEMRAALYARVSSEEQVEGYSIDAQIRAFQTLCQNKDWIPYREYWYQNEAKTQNYQESPAKFQKMVTTSRSRSAKKYASPAGL
jgi:DNA invertase Pin-like site-specific DNA recombinase